ncbi:hypothetical protein [Flavobacterium sasangense]|uniref:hypothetical protein n=1 Tax=Flavobacterium sasangense TaxID=503361 RepID=UPI000479748F|nr:hypothetical protein [Flavobacterium sasangense]
MIRYYSILFTFCFLISCQNNRTQNYPNFKRKFNSSEYKIKDKIDFSFKIPNSWNEIEVNGIDSDVSVFVNSLNDTITSDYGWYSNNLEEDLPTLYTKTDYDKLSQKEKNNLKENEYVIVEDYNNFDDKGISKSLSKFYVLDNKKAKIVNPKLSGIGITGVYFEKLYKERGNYMNLNLYGYNVKKETGEEILNVISTIKFKR